MKTERLKRSEPTLSKDLAGSRTFTEQEVNILDQAIRKTLRSRMLHLVGREKRFLNRALEHLRRYRRLPGFPVMLHHHRLGPFVFVTFLQPGRFQDAAPDHTKYELYRDGLCGMLNELFGGACVIGYRMGPHRGRTRGRHLHVALSLLRFPRSLEDQARAFREFSAENKVKAFPAFLVGPHLDAATIASLLVDPYSNLLHRVFGDFADDPATLVHVGKARDDVQKDEDRKRANRYLSNPWKKYEDKKLLGFYPHRQGGEVLVQHTGDDGQKRSLEAGAFVREYLLSPVEKWLRRGSRGFLHGRSHFSAVMDFAVEQPHPTNPKLCYLDQEPGELATLAAHTLDDLGDTFVTGSERTTRTRKMRKDGKDLFPVDQLGELLAEWPFFRLRFDLPGTAWPELWLPDRIDQALTGVSDLIPKHCEATGQTPGYLVLADVAEGSSDDSFSIHVLLSQVRFFKGDLDLIRGFLNLPPHDQETFLSAFFRHPLLDCAASVLDDINKAWRHMLQLHDVLSGGLVTINDDRRALIEILARSNEYFRQSIRQAIETLRIESHGKDSWRYIKPNGEVSTTFKSRETLGRHLDNLLRVASPRKFGFFHNRSETFGQIARMAVGRDLDALRHDSEAALEQLCDRLEVEPMTFRKLTITDLLGNAAKAHRAITG